MAERAARKGVTDLTQGPIARTLLFFALPTLGSSILQSLHGSINAIWVGRFLGPDALAATANANLTMFLMFATTFGFGMAATVLIGQSVGRHDIDAARRVVGTTVTLFAALSVLIAALGWSFAGELLALLATPPDIHALAFDYLRISFLAIPAISLSLLLTMCLRGTGDSMTPLWFLGLSAIVDVALNPVFILGLGGAPRMGIAGSALATLIANVISLLAMLAYIYARDLPIRLRGVELGYLAPRRAMLGAIVGKGVPMSLQMFVLGVAGLAMIGLVNREGAAMVAAYGAASQLWTYIQMPSMSVGAAVSAMAAQNIGAGRWDRVERITRSGIVLNLLITGSLVVIVTLVDRQVLGLFLGDETATIAIARHINLMVTWSFVLFGISVVLVSTVRANGVVIPSLLILAVSLLPVRIVLALITRPVLGVDGIWVGYCAGSAVAVVLMGAYYRWGRWREKRLVVPPSRLEVEEDVLARAEPAGKSVPNG